MRFSVVAAVLAAGFVAPFSAAAQTVYRYGNSYSHTPCPDAVEIDVSDPRSPAQKAQAEAAHARAWKAGKAMEKDRLADEKEARASGLETAKVLQKIDAAAAPKPHPPVRDEVRKNPKRKQPKKTAAKKKAEQAP